MSQGIDVNFYDVLGLRRTVTAIQIKAKFRQLALLKHPDKNPENPNATLEFQLIQTAYSTLIDPDRRRDYDENYYLAASQTASQKTCSGWNAWSWAIENGLERKPRRYCGPAGSNPVYTTAPDRIGRSGPDIPVPTPIVKIPEEPVTSPRPSTLSPATYQAERAALERQIYDLHTQRTRLATEAQGARADLAVINGALEQMEETNSTVAMSPRRPTLGAVFSGRKKAEEEARLQERVIARNLERRTKESERDRIRVSLGEMTVRLRGAVEGIAKLREDWEATWTTEQAGKDAVRAWEAREAEREKSGEEERAMAVKRIKAAESSKQEFEKACADVRAGKQKTADPMTNTPKLSTNNKAWLPYTTKPPSRPLPRTPDELKARLMLRERMIQEEIAEMDRCFAMMQQEEDERASTRAAQEAAAIYTDESLRPPPVATGPPPAYRPPSPYIQRVSVSSLPRPNGTICHHKGLWGPGQGRHACVRCRGPRGIIGVFRCKVCGHEKHTKEQVTKVAVLLQPITPAGPREDDALAFKVENVLLQA